MNGCIEFKGCKDKDGYGRVSIKGKIVGAHRAAYCKQNGLTLDSIKGFVVMHSCDNPSCVNPSHLSVGTHRDNFDDMVAKGRYRGGWKNIPSASGEKNGRSVLTENDVAKIREAYKPRCKINGGRALARKFGVDQKTISFLVNNKTWTGDRSSLLDIPLTAT